MVWAPVALVVLGAAIRLVQWLGGRSLWLDEALIARSLVSRDYAGLVSEPLTGDQAAPVLWLWATRLALDLFGEGERALRLVALLAGLAVLGLTWQLARRLLPPGLVPVAVAVVALHPQLVYFSNEVKPYSLDAAAVLAVALLALRVPWPARPGQELTTLTLTGAALVWASYAAVLALAGVSVALVLSRLQRRQWGAAVAVAAALSGWLASLAASYVLVLARHRSSSVLSSFWGPTFPDGPLDLPAWLVRRSSALVDDPLELALAPLALALLAVGAYRLAGRERHRAAVALAVVPMAVVAAALSAYPLASRLALWLVPLAAVVLAAVLLPVPRGAPWGRLVVAGAALVAVVAPSAADGLSQLVEVRERQELREVLEQLAAERRPDQSLIVDVPAQGAFDFYAPRTGVRRDGVITFVDPERFGGQCDDARARRSAGLEQGPVWLVFSHRLTSPAARGAREDLLARFAEVATPVRHLQDTGAEAYLFDASRGPSDAFAGVAPDPGRCLAVVRSG